MLRSLYIAGTGMLVQRKKMDVLTNNIANVETTGYKTDTLLSRSFKDMLIERMNDPAVINISNSVGPLNTGVHIDEVVVNFLQGNLEETERLTDLALDGPGFFTVLTPNGERYTRDGGFGINSEGCLVTADGYYVQGSGGAINVGLGGFAVDSQGNITVDGNFVDQLKIVSFEDLAGLRKTGSNLYVNYTGQAASQAELGSVRQGALEASNVDITRQMVDMMEISRTYELNQRMVKMIDESLGKTVNEVGRV
jgi:flagellar basal-body rod protein FlgG